MSDIIANAPEEQKVRCLERLSEDLYCNASMRMLASRMIQSTIPFPSALLCNPNSRISLCDRLEF